jgi:2-phospho-L-lactate/phosphoenolpyruvate guanylyltransferase
VAPETDIWVVVPVKERDRAKERLAPLLPPAQRRGLALAMLEDVLDAVAATAGVAGLVIVTVDAAARRLARRYDARIFEDGARESHSGAVGAAARRLSAEGRAGMLTLPADIPLATATEFAKVIAAHGAAPAFTIAPSHDERGSNAILVSPPDAVPLSFGADSFFPHLRAAEARGIRPKVVHLSGIALDIDRPEDLSALARLPATTRTRAFLGENAMLTPPRAAPNPTGVR